MENSIPIQIRNMLRHGVVGMLKVALPSLIFIILIFVLLKPGARRDIALRLAIVVPFIGFLWGLRVYEYVYRFSHWKQYLEGRATLARALTYIANKKIWVHMIIVAYLCGIFLGVILSFIIPLSHGALGKFDQYKIDFANFFVWMPAFCIFILFMANVFGPKPDDEEEIALKVVSILNQSPGISPAEIESPAAVERFVNGAGTGKGEGVKPYLWILSRIESPQRLNAFRDALKSADPVIRHTAATYLGRIGGSEALQLMQQHINDESEPEIRQLIENTLAKCAKDS